MDGDNSECEEEDWTLPADTDLQNERVSDVGPQRQTSDSKKCENSHSRVIAHIDMDCFYAQVEMIRNPALRNKPLGVKQKTIMVTSNYTARDMGVTKMMSIREAREKCPQLILVNGEDLTPYREMSYKISEFLQKYSSKVERHGFDENFLDLTEMVAERMKQESVKYDIAGHVYQDVSSDSCGCGCHARLAIGSQCVAEIRAALHKELCITCCGGIAHNRLTSKLVAGTHKPNQQTTLFPEQTHHLMSNLKSVGAITGIGHATSRRLQELGITTVIDLQNIDPSVLEEEFGPATTATMKKLCVGIDDSEVVPYRLPQTLSEEDSLVKCTTADDARLKIKQLITSLLKRLLDDGRTPHTLRLSIRRMSPANTSPNRESRQCPLPVSVFSRFTADNVSAACGQLEILAMGLLRKMVDMKNPLQLWLANVAFTKMEQKASNSIANFFSPKSEAKHDHLVSSGNINTDSKFKDNEIDSTSKASSDTDYTSEASRETDAAKYGLRSLDGSNEVMGDLCTDILSRLKHKDDTIDNRRANHFSNSKPKPAGILNWVTKSPTSTVNTCDILNTERVSKAGHNAINEMNVQPFFSKLKRKLETTDQSHRGSDEISATPVECVQLSKRVRHVDDSVKDTIPAGVDQSVFSELPTDIQKEILLHLKVGANSNTDMKSQIPLETHSSRSAKPCNGNNGNRIIPSMFKSTDLHNNENKSCADHSTVPQHQEDISGIENESRSSIVPPNIDKAVFLSLPVDIQNELRDEWKAKSAKTEMPHFKTPGKCSAANDILSYFSKTNKK